MLVALLAISGCATELVLRQDEALAVIPHRTGDSGHIVVDVMLNGEGPFKFALDTGASISVVFEDAAAASSIEPLAGSTVHVLGMTGSDVFPVARVGKLAVGSEVWEEARIALLPQTGPVANHVDGILGIDFLSRYSVWYSQSERVLRLYSNELVAESHYVGWSPINLAEMRIGGGEGRVFSFAMFVDGKRIITLFDLGATANLMNVRAARELDIVARKPRGDAHVYGVTGRVPILVELKVRKLAISHNVWRNRIFLVGEFPVFRALSIETLPVAIAGTSFFKDRDFIVDFARNRLLVKSRD